MQHRTYIRAFDAFALRIGDAPFFFTSFHYSTSTYTFVKETRASHHRGVTNRKNRQRAICLSRKLHRHRIYRSNWRRRDNPQSFSASRRIIASKGPRVLHPTSASDTRTTGTVLHSRRQYRTAYGLNPLGDFVIHLNCPPCVPCGAWH